MQRLAGRRTCPTCGTVYNVHSMPPGANTCSKDGAQLYQRPDDKEDVVAKRLEVYQTQTQPLIDHYSKLGLLRVVAGEGALEEVSSAWKRRRSRSRCRRTRCRSRCARRAPAAKRAAARRRRGRAKRAKRTTQEGRRLRERA